MWKNDQETPNYVSIYRFRYLTLYSYQSQANCWCLVNICWMKEILNNREYVKIIDRTKRKKIENHFQRIKSDTELINGISECDVPFASAMHIKLMTTHSFLTQKCFFLPLIFIWLVLCDYQNFSESNRK